MIKKPGKLIYKCEMCGEFTTIEVPDIQLALSSAIRGDRPYWSWALIKTKTIHNCEDGRIGISKLIGGQESDKGIKNR